MLVQHAIGALILMVKTVVTYVAVALTVLVAAGNELRRWRLVYQWIEGRQSVLRRAWATSLGLEFVLALFYWYVERRTEALVIDVLGIVFMVGLVVFLSQRGSMREVVARHEAEADGWPATRPAPDDEPRPRRRRPSLEEVPPAADEDDLPLPERPRRRTRRVPRY
jgi:hypothetical protein